MEKRQEITLNQKQTLLLEEETQLCSSSELEFWDVQGSIHSQLTELSIFLVFRTNFLFASYQQFRKPKHLFR